METLSAAGSIVRLTRLARAVYRRATDDVLGMSLKQFSILNQLRDDGPVPQGSLGNYLCLDANALVLLLNELEEAGWAQRRRDLEDRRRHIVEITAAGRRALQRAERRTEIIEDDVLAQLTDDERAQLHELLGRALDGLPPAPGR